MNEIPLRARDGSIRAHALVDDEDADLAKYRWYMHVDGYVVRTDRSGGEQRTLKLHREVLRLKPGSGLEADHINGDKLDNRRPNLRIVTRGQNMQNKRPYRGSTSRFRGVSRHGRSGKWMAQVQVNGRNHHLGEFDDELCAASVASAFRVQHMAFTNETRSAA